MYEGFFQLKKRPFVSAPLADRYFPAASIEAARQTLSRVIERAEGSGLVVGPAGTGKTLLLHVLAEQFRDQFSVALLAHGQPTTRRALLQAILFELGLPYRGLEEGELRLSLIDHLSPGPHCPNGMVLLIDEAHSLPQRLLEETRMITNLVRDGQPRVRLVLAGGPAIEERLASPRLEAFSQRITARCYLESLNRSETIALVRAQLAVQGGDADRLFTGDALSNIHRATDGVPRLINQLCDHALVLAFAGGRQQLDAAGIDEAWSDLQQLPTPWTESSPVSQQAEAGRDEVIEFGSLDDLDEPIERINSNGNRAFARIDGIADTLASIDDDFTPAGTIKPEVELTFDSTPDPFGERFEAEEVIVDRYASADAAFGARPHVYSSEGAAISAMLEPFLKETTGPRLAVAAHVDSVPDPVLPETQLQREPLKVEPRAARIAPATPSPSADFVESDDAEVIIVEDDPQPATVSRKPVLVRKQEFRQLFARLQRG